MAKNSRKKDREWLERYPGLYIDARTGVFFVRHPATRKQGSLKTRERQMAVRRWAILQQMWEQTGNDFEADLLAGSLAITRPAEAAKRITLKSYLDKWRTTVLGHQLSEGSVIWGDCHVLSQRGRNRGRPVAMATRTDYAADAQQLATSDDSQFFLCDPHVLRKVRKLLSP